MVTGSKKPILIVDDDDDNRGLLSALLSEIGYSVVEAKNGSRALDLLVSERQIEPCLIVLDLHMPEMSGREFLAVVCSYVRLSRIPVIVLTASKRWANPSSMAPSKAAFGSRWRSSRCSKRFDASRETPYRHRLVPPAPEAARDATE
jgi:CheY-like chemotaxis protein